MKEKFFTLSVEPSVFARYTRAVRGFMLSLSSLAQVVRHRQPVGYCRCGSGELLPAGISAFANFVGPSLLLIFFSVSPLIARN